MTTTTILTVTVPRDRGGVNAETFHDWTGPIPTIGSSVDGNRVIGVEHSFYTNSFSDPDDRSTTAHVDVTCVRGAG